MKVCAKFSYEWDKNKIKRSYKIKENNIINNIYNENSLPSWHLMSQNLTDCTVYSLLLWTNKILQILQKMIIFGREQSQFLNFGPILSKIATYSTNLYQNANIRIFLIYFK